MYRKEEPFWYYSMNYMGEKSFIAGHIINDLYSFFWRRIYKKPTHNRPVVYANETKINLPYSPDYKYKDGSSKITRGSATPIYDDVL